MAYDRYDARDNPREERARWREERFGDRDRIRSDQEDRGFFDRAGDEIASWFGDDEAERRRREDQRLEGRDRGWGRSDRDWRRDEDRGRFYGRDRDRSDRDEDRGYVGSSGYRGVRGEGGYRSGMWSGDRFGSREPDYRESSGNRFFAASGYARGGFGPEDYEREPYSRDEPLRGGSFGSERSREFDPHYHSWRQRQISDLDRDYEEYRRENQSRFESDFGSWRERRMQKRGLLGQIREQMEVVGNDDQHVGTIDRVAGDRIILAKSDPESGGAHHSLSCSDIASVEGDRVILDCTSEQAKQRWRDENRERALFEREDQGEMGDRALNRSFEGTYR